MPDVACPTAADIDLGDRLPDQGVDQGRFAGVDFAEQDDFDPARLELGGHRLELAQLAKQGLFLFGRAAVELFDGVMHAGQGGGVIEIGVEFGPQAVGVGSAHVRPRPSRARPALTNWANSRGRVTSFHCSRASAVQPKAGSFISPRK